MYKTLSLRGGTTKQPRRSMRLDCFAAQAFHNPLAMTIWLITIHLIHPNTQPPSYNAE